MIIDNLQFIAQTAPVGQPAPNPISSIIMMVLFMGAMWFLLLAPQRKKQKEHEKLIASLKAGDEVITNGGIYGTVVSIKDEKVVLRIAENTRIELAKPFIQSLIVKK